MDDLGIWTIAAFDLRAYIQNQLITDSTESDDLFHERVETRNEEFFWNQFSQQTDFKRLRDAYCQAINDMLSEMLFPSVENIEKPKNTYINFEIAVAKDLYILDKIITFNNESISDWLLLTDCGITNHTFCLDTHFCDETTVAIVRNLVNCIDTYDKDTDPETTENKTKSNSLRKTEIKPITATTKKDSGFKNNEPTKPKLVKSRKSTTITTPEPGRLLILAPHIKKIDLRNSNHTFREFVMRVGYKKVRHLKLTHKGKPLIVDRLQPGYLKITEATYLNCRMNTKTKCELVNHISKVLGIYYTATQAPS